MTYRERLIYNEDLQDLEDRLGCRLSNVELGEMDSRAHQSGLTLEEALEHAALNVELHIDELLRGDGVLH
ncbi:hypothetical protein SAMN02799622_01336 [Methylobacterium sp. UNC378MF]|uniref:hypothetical protein n=1 Tax=Methylobacterium sp. UNC378MF TaxID=1502748 RepID=UPI00088DBBE3|nr:hypothetical protein [Methylobacterium sp. UNC378MF]SDA15575.1 hypothetical protein SAMN02799622_01336 [Methylobacterium sp. UNC378MF]